jgi:tRNA pseudouridine55 synthase
MTRETARPRARLRRVDGVVLLDKPAGITSNAALQRTRRIFGAERAGHAGTLDPLATGLLVICLGEATKFAQLPTDEDKTYEAVIRLGVRTSTGDADGEVLERCDVACTPEDVHAAAAALTGPQSQVPPMHSALKHEGRPYYEYARAGVDLPRTARAIVIHDFEVVAVDGPTVRTVVRCSKGTYVRTLAEDLGRRLVCGAHLEGLRRTAVGTLRLDDAVGLDELERMPEEERRGVLRPIEVLLAGLQKVRLDAEETRRARHGLALARGAEGLVAMIGPAGEVVGLGEGAGGVLHPRRLTLPAPPGGADEELSTQSG